MFDVLPPFRLVDTLDARLIVRVTSAERDAVRRVAARHRVSMSEALRMMIRVYMGDTDGASGDLAHAKAVLGMTESRRRIERSLEKRLARARVRK